MNFNDNSILDFSNVTFKYKNENKSIIKDLSFYVNKGEFISIIGPSGCGKSTIFRIICGLEDMENGEVLIKDKNLYDLKQQHIGYMPQRDLLIPWRTILENTALPLEIQGKSKKIAKEEAEKYLDSFGFKNYKEKYPKDLSGGMKQRVSFIRTLLTGSNIMLLDEPFSALDAITKISMQEWLLDKWSSLNKTILFITHDVEEALFLSNRIFVVTNNPITTLKEVKVPCSYPRNRDMLIRENIINIKEELINELKQKVQL